jgi:hypothetical protein
MHDDWCLGGGTSALTMQASCWLRLLRRAKVIESESPKSAGVVDDVCGTSVATCVGKYAGCEQPVLVVSAPHPAEGRYSLGTVPDGSPFTMGRSSGSKAIPAGEPVSGAAVTMVSAAQRRAPCSIHMSARIGPWPVNGNVSEAGISQSSRIGASLSGDETSRANTAAGCLSVDGMPHNNSVRQTPDGSASMLSGRGQGATGMALPGTVRAAEPASAARGRNPASSLPVTASKPCTMPSRVPIQTVTGRLA